MATPAQRTDLRLKLGEVIPDGGIDEDSLFSNEQIDALIDKHGSPDAALGEGWRIKAGLLADLVDVTEGSSRRNLSSLHQNALRMALLYNNAVPPTDPTFGRTRVRQITRTGWQG
jgi:hypothetical protein